MACRCKCDKDQEKIQAARQLLDEQGRDDPTTPTICWQCGLVDHPDEVVASLKVELAELDISLSCEKCLGAPGHKGTLRCVLCNQIIDA